MAVTKTRGKKYRHPTMKTWLNKIGDEVVRRREAAGQKQDAFASKVRISRQQMGIIENGKRSYQIEPLVQILAGLSNDPVKELVSVMHGATSIDGETISACRNVIELLSDDRRQLTLGIIDALKNRAPSRQPGK